MFRFGILTEANDFHAYCIRASLLDRGHQCCIVELNRLAARGLLSWSIENATASAVVADVEGTLVPLAALDVIWSRRLHAPAVIPEQVRDVDARAVIDRNMAAALDGSTLTAFKGLWISDPAAVIRSAPQKSLTVVQMRVTTNSRRPFTSEVGLRAKGDVGVVTTLTSI